MNTAAARIGFLLATPLAATFITVPAHADPVANYTILEAPVICAALDTNPTLQGVSSTLNAIQADTGFTGRQTADVLVTAVEATCPRHLALLQRFVDTYAPTTGSKAI